MRKRFADEESAERFFISASPVVGDCRIGREKLENV